MKEPSKEKITQLINDGIRKAQRDFRKGSMSPLWWGPEYFITAGIYQSLLRYAKTDWLSLEQKPRSLREKWRVGRPRGDARLNGRCDLFLWYVNGDEEFPRALIEVKKNAKDSPDELGRIIELFQGAKHLEFAILAACLFDKISGNNKKDAEERAREHISNTLKDIHSKIKERLKSAKKNLIADLSPSDVKKVSLYDYVKSKECGTDEYMNWVWCPVCFVIS